MELQASRRGKRGTQIAIAAMIAVAIAGFAAYRFAIHRAEQAVMKALGPRGEVKELHVGLTGIEIKGLRIRAASPDTANTWPAEDELRAERIVVVPSFLDLMRRRVVLDSIHIEGAYLSVLRTQDGKVRVLPSQSAADPIVASDTALKPAPDAAKPSSTPVTIAKIELSNSAIDFFDASLRKSPVKQRLEDITGQVDNLLLPALTGQSTIRLHAIHKGVRHDGKVSVDGSIELATRESGLTTVLHGVDMVSLQPYLIKANEAGVSKGTLDFELNSSVKKGILYAPGSLVLSDLELTPSSASIMGIPLKVATKMLKNRKGKIAINFVLTGDINDPTFSLNENLSTRIAASVASKLGVDLEGLVKGVEGLGNDTATGIVKSLGSRKTKK